MHRHQTTVSMTQSTQTAHRGSWGWKRQTAAYDHPPARHSAPSTASIGFRTPAGDAASDDDARMEAKGVEASGRSLINTWGRMDTAELEAAEREFWERDVQYGDGTGALGGKQAALPGFFNCSNGKTKAVSCG